MNKMLIILFLLSINFYCHAQQEQQYTQFMYNKLSINPGYAGSKGVPCLTAVFRKQWIGLDGAPETQVLSFQGLSKNKKIGLGINFNRNLIGISERWTAEGNYAYRIKTGDVTLAIGIQASLRYYGANFSDRRLVSITPLQADGAIELGSQTKYLPNFGMGFYLDNKNFYLGFSVPRLLKNDLDFNELGAIPSSEIRHINAMAGFTINLSNEAILYPQLLIKYASNVPLSADINLNILLGNIITVGATYRTGRSSASSGESLDFILGGQISDRIFLGFSYDMTLSELKAYNQGGVEALVQYCFTKRSPVEFINPRYF
ncbi:MAG TPA: type IX secretion system membrane protein PorP/SprF [Saprospiraceae bacterium]|nr:type IX secretion system membrane protein PorP/SprF [Saprospiraceae bacterium]